MPGLQSLTENECSQVLAQTGHGGWIVGYVALGSILVAAVVLPVSGIGFHWGTLAVVAGLIGAGAAFIWAIITGTERGLKRELEKGQKLVVDGYVARLSMQYLDGVPLHCLRLETGKTDDVPLNVTIPPAVYRRLRESEAARLTCLPVSKLVLGVSTRRFGWSIGEP
jgi:hypothetical protein